MHHKLIVPYADSCQGGRLFLGATDEKEEDVWLDDFTREETGLPGKGDPYWGSGEPNGWLFQNCIVTKGLFVSDTICHRSSCAVCRRPDNQVWTLRGICELEERNYYFTAHKEGTDPITFRGYSGYVISYQGELWVLQDVIQNKIIATLNSSEVEFPIGRKLWNFELPVCGTETGERVLTLLHCKGDEFSCDDGSCVAMTVRCDMKYDCRDESDEKRCSIVDIPATYEKSLPPRSHLASQKALNIHINVLINSLNVLTNLMMLEISFTLRMSWHDTRLTFQNLKNATSLNLVPWHLLQKLWTPDVTFVNTNGNEGTTVDVDTVMTLIKPSITYQTDLTRPDVGM